MSIDHNELITLTCSNCGLQEEVPADSMQFDGKPIAADELHELLGMARLYCEGCAKSQEVQQAQEQQFLRDLIASIEQS